MSNTERQLRLVQSGASLFILVCFFIKRIGAVETRDAISSLQWLVVVAAIWSAVSGFTIQRRINRGGTRPQPPSSKSTQLGRWRTGNLIRLSTATAVGLWGLVLHYSAGPEWLVNIFLGVAMLLLLIWRPGPTPSPTQP